MSDKVSYLQKMLNTHKLTKGINKVDFVQQDDIVTFWYHGKQRYGKVCSLGDDYFVVEVNDEESQYKKFKTNEIINLKFCTE